MLANALKKNEALRELSVKGNELGDEGIKAICGALIERKTRFKALDCGNNRWVVVNIEVKHCAVRHFMEMSLGQPHTSL